MKLTIVVEELTEDRLADTLERIARQVSGGFTSGFDRWEFGRYEYKVDTGYDSDEPDYLPSACYDAAEIDEA